MGIIYLHSNTVTSGSRLYLESEKFKYYFLTRFHLVVEPLINSRSYQKLGCELSLLLYDLFTIPHAINMSH